MEKNVKFTILLDEQGGEDIRLLKEKKRISKGQIIRDALRAYAAMELYNSPTCANGRACFVPQMHNPQPVVQLPYSAGAHQVPEGGQQ